jgi:Chaperone of endosialidase
LKKQIFLFVSFVSVLFSSAQNIGIGTTTPVARLHVTDSNVLFSASGIVPVVPGNTPISGAGRRMMWYPGKAAFRVGYALGTKWDATAIGNYSFAAGYDTRAGGVASFALGFQTTSDGDRSIATGFSTTASGFASTAMGASTTASGDVSTAVGGITTANGFYSFAAGYSTIAKAHSGFTIGLYNDESDNPTTSLASTDRIFQIGNGTLPNQRNNALTVLRNGNMGIGTINPQAMLHTNNGSVVFTAPATLPVTPASTPISGAGHRMMWYADKAAFRLGRTTANQSDAAQVGDLSVAAGQDNIVSGFASAAFGMNNIVRSNAGYSFIGGFGNETRSVTAAAFGFNNIVKAQHGFVIGLHNDTSDVVPPLTINTADRLFQIGNGSTGNNRRNALTVLRNGNIGIGTVNPNAPLQFSNDFTNRKIVLWEAANNDHQFYGFGKQFGILRYQINTTNDNHIFYAGTSAAASNELFRIQGNGNAVLAGTLTQNSDARLKTNIHPLQFSLHNIQQLNGYTYNWIDKDRDSSMQTGLLAQEVQKLFPQLVKQDENGTLSVNYTGFIPVLIEAMKEQQKQITAQQTIVEKQQQEITELKLLIRQIINASKQKQ